MQDVVAVVTIIAFFALCTQAIRFCERITGTGTVASPGGRGATDDADAANADAAPTLAGSPAEEAPAPATLPAPEAGP